MAKGAEAELYLVDWFGTKAVLKWRKPKAYRDPSLDYHIRRRRTINEVRNMYIAHTLGVQVPSVYFFDPEKAVIYMEYVEGESLRELINKGHYHLLKDVGRYVGLMHQGGLIHGDLAPTNVIISGKALYFIDFGLGDVKKTWNRRAAIQMARDVNVLLRNLEMYGDTAEELKRQFWTGYAEVMKEKTHVVQKEVAKIRASGRYVERRGSE